MTEEEIVDSYKRNGRGRGHIRILAELNACSERTIEAILVKEGLLTEISLQKHGKKKIPETVRRLCEEKINELEKDIKDIREEIKALNDKAELKEKELRELTVFLEGEKNEP